MAITSEIFDGALPGLSEALSTALLTLGGDGDGTSNLLDGAEPELLGPFAAYSADARVFLETGNAERVGWRGLLLQDEGPIAVVDVHQGKDGQPSYGFRGQEPAAALATALRQAQHYEDGDAHYRVRWITLPEIYVTALWLVGDTTFFIPTRLGSAERPDIKALSAEDFLARIATLIETASWSDAPEPDDPESPRSGLAPRG